MKCPNCDQEVEASAAFCGNCGHQLQTSAQSDQPAAPAAAESASPAVPAPAASTPSDAAAPTVPTASAPEAPVAPVVEAANAPQAPAAPIAGQVPAYAVGQEQSKSAKRLTLAMVLAALSIPGAIIPIIGFGLAVTALVIASNHKQAGKSKMITASVLAGLGLVLSILAFNYNLNEYNKRKQTGFSAGGSLTASVSAAGTGSASYSVLLDK